MIWFDKQHPDAIYMDNRELTDILCDGRTLNIHPNTIADFRDMPFADDAFSLVVFDPPHLLRAGVNSWLAKKYGLLNRETWQADIGQGFRRPLFGNRNWMGKTHWLVFMKGQCMRVIGGVLE